MNALRNRLCSQALYPPLLQSCPDLSIIYIDNKFRVFTKIRPTLNAMEPAETYSGQTRSKSPHLVMSGHITLAQSPADVCVTPGFISRFTSGEISCRSCESCLQRAIVAGPHSSRKYVIQKVNHVVNVNGIGSTGAIDIPHLRVRYWGNTILEYVRN